MRLGHRVRTSATPAQLWGLLGDSARWPEYELCLRAVRGGSGRVSTGQHLLGVGRGVAFRVPIDVVDVVPERRLVVRVHVAPGVTEELTCSITPTLRGGCDLSIQVVVEGLFARSAALPLWLARGLTTRVLVRRVEKIARAARQAA